MIYLLNFSHPFTREQLATIADDYGIRIEDITVISCPVQIDMNVSLKSQVEAIISKIGFSPDEWQTQHIIMNPPALSNVALVTVAELHGRIGHYPHMIRIVANHSGTITTFDIAEIINLDIVRANGRVAR